MKFGLTINWKKALTIVLDIALAAYLVVAVTAFNKPDETAKVCTKVMINIADETTNGFIKSEEIKKRLQTLKLHPLGKPMRYVDARKIEESLKASPFVQTAECYKTQNGQVNRTTTTASCPTRTTPATSSSPRATSAAISR